MLVLLVECGRRVRIVVLTVGNAGEIVSRRSRSKAFIGARFYWKRGAFPRTRGAFFLEKGCFSWSAGRIPT